MNKYQELVEKLPTFPGQEDEVRARAEQPRPETELDKAEQELGFALPDDYRNFLRFYGNLSLIAAIDFPKDGVHPAYGGCEYFFGVDPLSGHNNIAVEYKDRLKVDDWPKHLLPITVAENGYMCLVVDRKEAGAIYFLHVGQDAHSKEEDNVYFVAESFDAFIRMLY